MVTKSAPPKILVVDDDVRLRDLLTRYLGEQGFQVAALADARDIDKKLQRDPPHLVVLDLMLPGEDGLSVCRRLRGAGESVPIIMLTAKGEEVDRIVGLEMGADDYVTKPFSPRELVARVKALLRRTEPPSEVDRPIEIGKLLIDPSAYRVTRSGKPLTLSTLEFRLVHYLAARPNRVFSRDQLLDAVWGTERFVTPRSVDVYIRRLREKIETDPENPVHLKTVRGAGYLFESAGAG
jgi:two-component system, OmpR family, phosphate regulon response regulator OmpR